MSNDTLTPAAGRVELDEAMDALSTISGTLLDGFQTLAERASRVEDELSIANAALAAKVRELDHTTRRLEAILEALPTGVVVRDADGSVSLTNRAACELLDVSSNAEVQSELERHIPDQIPENTLVRFATNGGSPRVVATRTCVIEGLDQTQLGSIRILDDRTEQTAMAEKLSAKNKLTSLGTLAAGIAHEIRNPLNAVMGFADLLARSLDSDSHARRWAQNIQSGATEMNAIVGSMLDIANPEQLSVETVDVEELVEQAVIAALPPGSQLDSDDFPFQVTTHINSPPFLGDRMKLRHALRNLVANAFDIQPNGGTVDVSVDCCGSDITLRVDDAGPGVPPELRERIGDPFFTTRAEGTGLGLALVQTIAQLHGGQLIVHSQPSPMGGARLSIRIPTYIPSEPA